MMAHLRYMLLAVNSDNMLGLLRGMAIKREVANIDNSVSFLRSGVSTSLVAAEPLNDTSIIAFSQSRPT